MILSFPFLLRPQWISYQYPNLLKTCFLCLYVLHIFILVSLLIQLWSSKSHVYFKMGPICNPSVTFVLIITARVVLPWDFFPLCIYCLLWVCRYTVVAHRKIMEARETGANVHDRMALLTSLFLQDVFTVFQFSFHCHSHDWECVWDGWGNRMIHAVNDFLSLEKLLKPWQPCHIDFWAENLLM